MLHAALVLAALVILADAWTTRRALIPGKHEDNKLRLFLVQHLGRNGGTLGVGIVAAVAFVWLGWNWPEVPTTVVSVLFVTLAFGWVAYHNYKKGNKR